MLGVVLFIPMTLYYILPSFVSGGHGFVGQMGIGPKNLSGFLIAIAFWSIIAVVMVKLKLHLNQKRANQSIEPVVKTRVD
jgi:hypothetical protein